ncbi:Uncharacterised protein [Legionella donaldsonii]|uniref:Uncharacterized protein n=1 Tax=Legionella donaldsonii TaxID=45060 RepID=A0A378J0M8_9GAMM|nr:hypothetical protein [Legionella donaldsonii]STX41059.1 Uncharacterised protein [Legionella donaldsonii]
MPKSFFNQQNQKSHAYEKLLQQNKIKERKTRISKAHIALEELEHDIEARTKKLHEIFAFLEAKKALYQQLTEKYQLKPLPTLATRLNNLKQAIDDLVSKIEKAQPKEVINDLSARYKELKTELARKETLINKTDTAKASQDKQSTED